MNRALSCVLLALVVAAGRTAPPEVPRATDDRLEVRLFAAAPDIVHPVGIDFDHKGRLLVIESHTHFPPANYRGPKHDRIRILEDTDGDGKADRFTTFFEGTAATMDIAVHPGGAVYLATRNEILRLRDADGDGKAEVKERLVFLDTKGNYPHNGLSGLCFDARGDFYFGMGENLGAEYKLIGADGVTLRGEGEGGNVFHCSADGKQLRRVATGFWNPFGVCRDIYGRLFAVDNDPDQMPPCRMMHVVEGADFGYQFRYGRAGRHPFQAWNGQLAGTLPMMSGTGEAPCEILSYESDGLPREYLGNLLVASWADHRIERYDLREQGSSFVAERKPFVQGGAEFRPVGLAVAPDGSLFLSDWVRRDYTLHGQGAIWQLRAKQPPKVERPREPQKALLSGHRPLREAAARQLVTEDKGRTYLREQLRSEDVRVRAAALTALNEVPAFAKREADNGLRALAVRTLAERGAEVAQFLTPAQPAEVRREAVAGLRRASTPLLELLASDDPYLRHAAIHQLARVSDLLDDIDVAKQPDARHRLGLLLAHRATERAKSRQLVSTFLNDADAEVRFLAAKWVADEKLTAHRAFLTEELQKSTLNVRLFTAYSTALARLDGKEVNEGKLADYFVTRLLTDNTPAALRALSLQQVPANHPRLTLDLLGSLLESKEAFLQREAVRALSEHPAKQREALLLDAALNAKLPGDVRAHAVLGLSENQNVLTALARGDNALLSDEALRALTGTKLSETQQRELEKVAGQRPSAADLVARVLGKPFYKDRPPTKELDAWLKRLDGAAEVEAGRRVFFQPRLAACARCHRVEGRGQEVGPDLSAVGHNERRRIVESILQPSVSVAPHYQAYLIETSDGKLHTGMLLRTYLDEYTYVDPKGGQFKLNTRNIVESRPAPTSIMPDGLVNLLTDQELRDLVAYLCSRR